MQERYQLLKRIFQEAIELEGIERVEYLDRSCAGDEELRTEVEALLADLDGELPHPGAQTMRPLGTGEFFGPYQVAGRIGEGGMGTVYEATQESPRRTVALKVLRPEYSSPSMVARFEQEVQVLGQLQHPGIAQIFGAGAAHVDGGAQPYFAMELVRGVPMDEYAAQRTLGTREKLEIFVKICDAVSHAHQKGIVHRDLKPDNILITAEGEPKILDFGIARVTDLDEPLERPATLTGQIIGTPAYMSPEQAAGNSAGIDIRSDIYSLGVLLYEWLTGRLPYDIANRSLLEVVRIIEEAPPARAGSLRRELRGDVETILGMSLEKEKERRYPSAHALGSDVARFLNSEPILARPPSTIYQLRKFAGRHRALVAGTLTTVLAITLGFAVSLFLFFQSDSRRVDAEEARRAESDQRVQAVRRLAEARAVNDFLVGLIERANPRLHPRGGDMSVEELLDAAALEVQDSFEDEPEVEASIRYTLGCAFSMLARFDTALLHAQRALTLHRNSPVRSAVDLTADLLLVGSIRLGQGDYDGASRELHEALSISVLEVGPRRALTAEVLSELGRLDFLQGEFDDALERLHQAREIHVALTAANSSAEELGAVASASTKVSLYLGELHRELEQYEEAVVHLEAALDDLRTRYGHEHLDVAACRETLSAALMSAGDHGRAESESRETLRVRELILGEAHPLTTQSASTLANILATTGVMEEAEALYRDALRGARESLGNDHIDLARYLNNLALLLRRSGRALEAEDLYREALDLRLDILGAQHPETSYSFYNLARLLEDDGRYEEALDFAQQALAIRHLNYPVENTSVDYAYRTVINLLRHLRDWEGAEACAREELALRMEALDSPHLLMASARIDIGDARWRIGDMSGAATEFAQVFEIKEALLGPEHEETLDAQGRTVALLRRSGQLDEAETLALALLDVVGDDEDLIEFSRSAIQNLFEISKLRGDESAAKEWLGELDR